MKKEGPPFINTLRISLLEKPEIDISVEILGFPDILLVLISIFNISSLPE